MGTSSWPFLERTVVAGAPVLRWVQRVCGVNSDAGGPLLLHYIFKFGAAMGNELWYILFLPFLFWEYDLYVARNVIYLWCGLYYTGQVSRCGVYLSEFQLSTSSPYPCCIAGIKGHSPTTTAKRQNR